LVAWNSEAGTCPTYSPSVQAFACTEPGVVFGRPPDIGGLAVQPRPSGEIDITRSRQSEKAESKPLILLIICLYQRDRPGYNFGSRKEPVVNDGHGASESYAKALRE
jgi:hypothetical protein